MALNPLYGIFLNLKADHNLTVKNVGHRALFLSYKHFEVTLRVFLTDCTVAMVLCAKDDHDFYTNEIERTFV